MGGSGVAVAVAVCVAVAVLVAVTVGVLVAVAVAVLVAVAVGVGVAVWVAVGVGVGKESSLTKAFPYPSSEPCEAPTIGKSVEVVVPETYALLTESRAIARALSPADCEMLPLPPK